MGSLGRRRFSRSEIAGGTGYWLVDVEIGGHVYRWSTTDLDVPSDDGTLHYDGVLEGVSYQVAMELFQVANPHAVNITAMVDGMPDILRSGRNIRGIAEASRWYRGMTWEERVPKVRGFVSDPEIGEDFLTCSITAEAFNDRGIIPETNAKVDASTWSATWLSGEDYGLAYPLILGRPGAAPLDWDGVIAGSQGVWVSRNTTDQKLVIAGHRVGATEVTLFHDDFSSGRRFTVYHTQDARGRTVAYLSGLNTTSSTEDGAGPWPHDRLFPYLRSSDFTSMGFDVTPTRSETIDLFVGWKDWTDSDLGGAIGTDGQLIRKAGDVMRFVLGYSSLKVDDGAFASEGQLLDGFNIDAVIEAGCSPWQWCVDNLFDILPVSFIAGPWGVRPIVFRWFATEADAVATLDEDEDDVEFDDSIEISTDHLINKASLDYGWDMRTQAFRFTSRIDAEAEETTAYAGGRITADLSGANGASIEISSTTAGQAGVYRIALDGTGVSQPVAGSYNAANRTVTLVYQSTVSTTDDFETGINGLAQIACDTTGSTDIWSASDTPDIILKLGDEGTAGSYHCKVSQGYYLDENGEAAVYESTFDSKVVYDPNTAAAILQWKTAALALEHRRVIVSGRASMWEWLEVGNVVLLNCERLALAGALAHIEEIEIHDDDEIIFRCLMIWDPTRYDVL